MIITKTDCGDIFRARYGRHPCTKFHILSANEMT